MKISLTVINYHDPMKGALVQRTVTFGRYPFLLRNISESKKYNLLVTKGNETFLSYIAFQNDVKSFCLHMAEDDGEVDTDFPGTHMPHICYSTNKPFQDLGLGFNNGMHNVEQGQNTDRKWNFKMAALNDLSFGFISFFFRLDF